MKKLSLLGFAITVALALISTGCGGHGGGSVTSARSKAKHELDSTLKLLKTALGQVSGRTASAKRSKSRSAQFIQLAETFPVSGFDETYGFWYSGTQSTLVEDIIYYSDEAMTIQVGYRHVSNPDAMDSPQQYTFDEEITTGPLKHKDHSVETHLGTGTDGNENITASRDFTDTDDMHYVFSMQSIDGAFSYTSTVTAPDTSTVTVTRSDLGNDPTTVTFTTADSYAGTLTMGPGGDGTGVMTNPDGQQVLVMSWDSQGNGVVDYGDNGYGDPDGNIDMSGYIH